jgi:phage shock protein C
MNKTDKTLTRSTSDRMISGVSAGLADYFGIETVFVRVGFIVGTVVTSGAAAVAYVALMLLMKTEDDTVDMNKSPLPV